MADLRTATAARRTSLAALALAAAVLGWLALSSGETHRLRATFQSALQVLPGEQVRIAGRTVGSVASVGLDHGLAIVEMTIDGSAWPLHQGTTGELRFGSAAGYATRFVELHPGPHAAPSLPQDGVLALAHTTTPVEFDQVFDTFPAPTRAALAGTIQRTPQLLSGHAGDLAATLQRADTVESLAGAMQDLARDPYALSQLVGGSAGVAGSLAARDGQLARLTDQSATTFATLAATTTAQERALDALPATLTAARGTLSRLDASLGGLSGLVADLAPGASGLRRVAPTLHNTLVTLQQVAPKATATLRTGTRSVPALSRFLDTANAFLPGLTSALSSANPMLDCIRPYTPEIAGFAGTWDGFTENFDGAGHYARILVQESPLIPGTPLDSRQATALPSGGLRYAMPRPPGLNAGQPWFLPQCGAGPSSLDPNADPENTR